MKISDCWQAFYDLTGKASDVSRQLALAGLALIWLFQPEKQPTLAKIPDALQGPTVLFIIALGLDLLQYLTASIVWGIFSWNKEKTLKSPKDDPDFDAPRHINILANILFLLKVGLVITGYCFLLSSLFRS